MQFVQTDIEIAGNVMLKFEIIVQISKIFFPKDLFYVPIESYAR